MSLTDELVSFYDSKIGMDHEMMCDSCDEFVSYYDVMQCVCCGQWVCPYCAVESPPGNRLHCVCESCEREKQ
jgi:hypothetical protein